MFTAVAHKNLADAESYFDEHLAQNDYYAAGEVRPGLWIGTGAERLGLSGQVTREQFHALCENRYPQTGEQLTLRQNAKNDRRVFFDFTCSPPKSVSVLAVTMNDERLVAAHEEAMRVAFRELETFAATRIRKNGSQRDRMTGNLVAAAFVHDSSRELDPLLHTHCTVFNATFDENEHCWKALQARPMYDAMKKNFRYLIHCRGRKRRSGMRDNTVPAWRYRFTGKKLILTRAKRLLWSLSKMIQSKFNVPMVLKLFSHWVEASPHLMWERNGN